MEKKSMKRKREAEGESSTQKSKKSNTSDSLANGAKVSASADAQAKKSHKPRRKHHKKNKSHPAALPVEPDKISSNWKNLLKTLEAEKPTKKQNPIVYFSAKRRKKFKEVELYSAKKKEAVKVEEPKKKPEIWFDDVDETLLDPDDRPNVSTKYGDEGNPTDASNGEGALVKERAFKGPTKIIGIDCEMVGVGHGGKDSVLARVSLVNHFGHCIYDKYVKPREKVTDYRTAVSGIRPKDIENGEDFKVVQKEVSDLLQGRVLVGHSLKHDLKVLFLDHPRKMIRDTSTYKYFRNAFGGKTPSLKRLSERMLGVKVQEGEHSSVQDAQAAVRLYTMFRKQWEADIKNKVKKDSAVQSKRSSANMENFARQNFQPKKVEAPKRDSRPLYTDSD